MEYCEITEKTIPELAQMYVQAFQAPPWNEQWTVVTAGKRLRQMVRTEDSYGIAAYADGTLCGAVLGCKEQFFDGMMFQIKEFFINSGMRGKGIGTAVYQELESRLKGEGIRQIILFTRKGADTEHFYHKQGFHSEDGMVFMGKRL